MKKKLKDNDFELLRLEEIEVELGDDIAESLFTTAPEGR